MPGNDSQRPLTLATACAMFASTKKFFDGWLSQCANYIILQILFTAAQSVMLMIIVVALTAVQFRYIDRRVNYK